MSDTNALRQRIAEELGLRPANLLDWQGSNITVAYAVNREINSAIKHYESTRFRWNEVREATLATTVSGTRIYSLPAALVRLDTLKIIHSGAYIFMRPKTWEEIEERDTQVTGSQGTPYEYAIYGNVLRLYPVPNAARTLIASYIRRYGPTSLTLSFCSVTTMGGGSLTATLTGSHNNRMDGWTTDGEELIRARACAAIRINYLKDAAAVAEMSRLTRDSFMSFREKIAFERLADEANDLQSSGFVKPYCI